MLAQVFYLYRAEGTQARVQCSLGKLYTNYFQALDQLAAEVHTRSGRSHSTFVLGIYRLVAFFIFFFRLALDVFRQWCFAQYIQHVPELLLRTIKKETDGTATRCSIIYYFCYQLVIITKVQLVANAYLTRRIYDHIPQVVGLIQFAQQEHFYFGPGLFLTAIQAGRKNLGIVHHHYIFIVEIAQNIFEHFVLYFAAIAMHHHQTALFTFFGRMLCY